MMRQALLILLASTLMACSWVHARHIPVQQGNELTQENINKLKPGMTPATVQTILGPPVLITTFENSRLHYVYTMKDQGNTKVTRVTLTFSDGKLTEIVGKLTPERIAVHSSL